jgi:pilus assembly protein CpaF
VTSTAYELIRREAVDLIEAQKIDTRIDRDGVEGLVASVVEDYQRRAHLGEERSLHDPAEMIGRVVRSIADFGPLTEILKRADVEEVFVEGGRVSYIDGSGQLKAISGPTTDSENRQVINRLLADTDRHLDTSNPIVQARVLSDSARLTAVIPPVADSLSATIRRYALRKETLPSLVDRGAMTPAAAGFLWALMQTGLSVLISGPPGAGKTSLLSAMMAAAPPEHCMRCCEEVRELHVPIVHGSYYEARPPALDGKGAISLRDLVKIVLAMRPDRIVVGEVRGAEAFELTRAVNAGCGFACTVHANSAVDALHAIVNAALMAGENVGESVVRKVFESSIDIVIHVDRDSMPQPGSEGLRRQVMEIVAVVPSLREDFSTAPIFMRQSLGSPLDWTGSFPPEQVSEIINRSLPSGVDLKAILEGRSSPG